MLDFIREITGRNPVDALNQKSLKRKIVKELRGRCGWADFMNACYVHTLCSQCSFVGGNIAFSDLVVTTTHTGRNLYVHGILENDATKYVFLSQTFASV